MKTDLSKTKIGFEIEFYHDWKFTDIINDLKELFPKSKWISDFRRKKKKYYKDSKSCFTLGGDGSVDPKYDDQTDKELITPVWNYYDAKSNLKKIFEWMEDSGAETNYSTGLHVNISFPKINKIEPIVLITELKDRFWLKRFGRRFNYYCLSQSKVFPDLYGKHRSVNFYHENYLEFRIIGGKDYHLKTLLVFQAIDHFAESSLKSIKIK